MELQIIDGDYVHDGAGGMRRVSDMEELLQRVRLRLCARRGTFPFAPDFGSELHLLCREKPGARDGAAQRYVAEALAEETEVRLVSTELRQEGDTARLHVSLRYGDEEGELALSVEGE